MPNVPQDIPTTGFLSAGVASGGASSAAGKGFGLTTQMTALGTGGTLPINFTVLTKQLINNLTAVSGLQLVRGQDFPRGDGNR